MEFPIRDKKKQQQQPFTLFFVQQSQKKLDLKQKQSK